MKKLLLGIMLLLVVAAVAIELIAPRLAADSIEANVREHTGGAVGVSADVGTFPVVTRLLATERVSRVGVTLDEVVGQQLTFTSVRFELRGVLLDRDALMGGDVRVRGMRGGQATAVLDVDALAAAVGAPVRLEDGNLVVDVAGAPLEVPLLLEGRALSLPGGLPPITLPDIVPCAPTQTSTQAGRIELSCTLEDVPFIFT